MYSVAVCLKVIMEIQTFDLDSLYFKGSQLIQILFDFYEFVMIIKIILTNWFFFFFLVLWVVVISRISGWNP